MAGRDDSIGEAAARKSRIVVVSDLPELSELEPWERTVIVPVALELLAPLVQGLEGNGSAQENQDHDGRPLRAGVDR